MVDCNWLGMIMDPLFASSWAFLSAVVVVVVVDVVVAGRVAWIIKSWVGVAAI